MDRPAQVLRNHDGLHLPSRRIIDGVAQGISYEIGSLHVHFLIRRPLLHGHQYLIGIQALGADIKVELQRPATHYEPPESTYRAGQIYVRSSAINIERCYLRVIVVQRDIHGIKRCPQRQRRRHERCILQRYQSARMPAVKQCHHRGIQRHFQVLGCEVVYRARSAELCEQGIARNSGIYPLEGIQKAFHAGTGPAYALHRLKRYQRILSLYLVLTGVQFQVIVGGGETEVRHHLAGIFHLLHVHTVHHAANPGAERIRKPERQAVHICRQFQ